MPSPAKGSAGKDAAPAKTKRKTPKSFSRALAIEFCMRVAGGRSVDDVCRDEDMPSSRSIYFWLWEEGVDYDGFRRSFDFALDMRLDAFREQMLAIADNKEGDVVVGDDGKGGDRVFSVNANVQRARLMVETRQWIMARMAPKRYGDGTTLRGDPKDPVAHRMLPAPTVEIITDPEPAEPKPVMPQELKRAAKGKGDAPAATGGHKAHAAPQAVSPEARRPARAGGVAKPVGPAGGTTAADKGKPQAKPEPGAKLAQGAAAVDAHERSIALKRAQRKRRQADVPAMAKTNDGSEDDGD